MHVSCVIFSVDVLMSVLSTGWVYRQSFCLTLVAFLTIILPPQTINQSLPSILKILVSNVLAFNMASGDQQIRVPQDMYSEKL